ncbi:MAG: substrate-binding domain-containing protein [Pseudomonadota bacterium]
MPEWLWDGLPPAERVVAAALAEAGAGVIYDAQLEHLLYESGVRVVIRELQNAPQLLQDWDLIEPEMQQAVLLSNNRESAHAFMEFVRSDEAKAIIQGFGYEVQE